MIRKLELPLFLVSSFLLSRARNHSIQMKTLPSTSALLALFCISLVPLQADDFQAGIEAYQNSNYAEAANAFTNALASEPSAAARHNLALSYFQMGAPAQAVFELERAVRLDPLNESYLFKLGALRQQLGLYAVPAEWWQSAARLLPPHSWIWITCISAWLLLASIILPCMAGKRRPAALKLLIGICIPGMLLPAMALFILHTLQADGVVLSEAATKVHHAPASAAPEAGLARPGERAHITDTHGDFLKIETEARITGWIQKDALGRF